MFESAEHRQLDRARGGDAGPALDEQRDSPGVADTDFCIHHRVRARQCGDACIGPRAVRARARAYLNEFVEFCDAVTCASIVNTVLWKMVTGGNTVRNACEA